jgi:Zn-dependent protease
VRRAWASKAPGIAGIVRVFGVELDVDPLVIVFAALYALAGSLWQWAIVFASLIVHEASHAMAATGFGYAVARISITPIGAVASLEGEIQSRPEAEAAVAMAGPMTSLILASLGYLLLLLGSGVNNSRNRSGCCSCATWRSLPGCPYRDVHWCKRRR